MNWPKRVKSVCSAVCGRRRLGESEVDDPRHRLAVHLDDQNVGGLEVTMDDGFLVRVLHALAGLDEQLQPLADLQLLLVAILRDRQARHVLHDEVRLALGRDAGIEHLGDGRVIHDRERLPFRLKALHDRLVVHARLDQLQGHGPAHRCGLLGEPYLPHAAFAQSADELKPLGKELSRRQAGGVKAAAVRTEFSRRRRLQELGAQAVADREQCLELRAQLRVRRADLIEELWRAARRRVQRPRTAAL